MVTITTSRLADNTVMPHVPKNWPPRWCFAIARYASTSDSQMLHCMLHTHKCLHIAGKHKGCTHWLLTPIFAWLSWISTPKHPYIHVHVYTIIALPSRHSQKLYTSCWLHMTISIFCTIWTLLLFLIMYTGLSYNVKRAEQANAHSSWSEWSYLHIYINYV